MNQKSQNGLYHEGLIWNLHGPYQCEEYMTTKPTVVYTCTYHRQFIQTHVGLHGILHIRIPTKAALGQFSGSMSIRILIIQEKCEQDIWV